MSWAMQSLRARLPARLLAAIDLSNNSHAIRTVIGWLIGALESVIRRRGMDSVFNRMALIKHGIVDTKCR